MTLDTTTLRGITESLPADEFITYTELGIILFPLNPGINTPITGLTNLAISVSLARCP
ncbi:hypothetical protein QE193_23635 (plasmid) [Arsenophonus nasoniae]|uniref:hypothetical protein n=1 Tax=Arsenophonus nasoniae TaxID=638 RepID=UPI002469B6E7|nr:hypothetical protein [Arsenophonus nasoniae]WGM18123.1 hypothetical protein QE193_23635 [Arsenophonus nasoniae]